jgi:hypothetical protein
MIIARHFSFILPSQTDSQRLVKSFSENIFKFLKIQLFTVNVNVKKQKLQLRDGY